MRVCLIGYGKMGKAIEEILLQRSHEITGQIGNSNRDELIDSLKKSEVAIEFTHPEAAVHNLKLCFEYQVPVVCGTTGWLNHWNEIIDELKQKNGSLLFASNFSIGVQIFFALNKNLAAMMSAHHRYKCNINEIHHTQKKDAPSGTAISLANDILAVHPDYQQWSLNPQNDSNDLGIHSERIETIVGTHVVSYTSPIDQISIKHEAYSREGFASGAVLAAEWLKDKKGLFSMNDVLNL
jgi:4-hydroxy-tetrahydrodipicolinate reductase